MSEYYVLLVNDTGTDDSVISSLKNIETVKTAYGAFGSYDIIAKLESPDEIRIEQDISRKIRRLPQIRSTLTLEINTNGGFRKTTSIENKVLEKHMVQAYIMIHCNHSHESHVIENLKKIPEVIETNVLVGSYELICKIIAPTYDDISEIIGKKIRKLEHIKSTITLNIVGNQGFQKLS